MGLNEVQFVLTYQGLLNMILPIFNGMFKVRIFSQMSISQYVNEHPINSCKKPEVNIMLW